MEDRSAENFANPVGLYHNPGNGAYIGVLDPAQADAVVRQGFNLVKEGEQAAKRTQAEIDAIVAKREAAQPAPASEEGGIE